jgi:DNA polymerase I-like protein with 3'-5' exonuclease and polymerase domains
MQVVKNEMVSAVTLPVPLTIDMKAANNWLEAH